MAGPDTDAAVRNAFMLIARSAGVTIAEGTAASLTPVLASVLTEWETLTRAVAPEVEPMSAGRWPEGGHEVE